MPAIKTRSAVKSTIKTINRARIAGQRTLQRSIATKDKIDNTVNENEKPDDIRNETTTEYATERFKTTGVVGAKAMFKVAKKTPKAAYKTTKQTVKVAKKAPTAIKNAVKTTKNTIKTAKNSIKATKESIKTAQNAKEATKIVAKAGAKVVKVAAKAVVKLTKATVKAVGKAVAELAAAGGWVVALVVILIVAVAAVVIVLVPKIPSTDGSIGEDNIAIVRQQLGSEYNDKINKILDETEHDKLVVNEDFAKWEDVFAVFVVKNQQVGLNELITEDTSARVLKEVYWDMNILDHHTEEESRTEMVETDDGHGNIVQQETTITETVLYISVTHKTVDEITAQYGFDDKQKEDVKYYQGVQEESHDYYDDLIDYGEHYQGEQTE